ncbi:MAG: YkgJ family cysteine cluster protein [Chitinophagaceae bacterium]|nr:YkgJ family cysteine cluster protein [Chitinophagaceae bacterium]
MAQKEPVNLRSYKKKMLLDRNSFRRFLTRIEKNPIRGLEPVTPALEKRVWEDIDCLNCANCCKTMTPTFTPADMKRISAHLGMTEEDFKKKWLYKERSSGDWMNKKEPCQFLDTKTNMCNIYEVRPADCAGFPHLQKKLKDFIHIHKQNVEYCPATHKMVEKMKQWESGELIITPVEKEKALARSKRKEDMSMNSGPVTY